MKGITEAWNTTAQHWNTSFEMFLLCREHWNTWNTKIDKNIWRTYKYPDKIEIGSKSRWGII